MYTARMKARVTKAGGLLLCGLLMADPSGAVKFVGGWGFFPGRSCAPAGGCPGDVLQCTSAGRTAPSGAGILEAIVEVEEDEGILPFVSACNATVEGARPFDLDQDRRVQLRCVVEANLELQDDPGLVRVSTGVRVAERGSLKRRMGFSCTTGSSLAAAGALAVSVVEMETACVQAGQYQVEGDLIALASIETGVGNDRGIVDADSAFRQMSVDVMDLGPCEAHQIGLFHPVPGPVRVDAKVRVVNDGDSVTWVLPRAVVESVGEVLGRTPTILRLRFPTKNPTTGPATRGIDIKVTGETELTVELKDPLAPGDYEYELELLDGAGVVTVVDPILRKLGLVQEIPTLSWTLLVVFVSALALAGGVLVRLLR